MAARRAYALVAHSSEKAETFQVPPGVTILFKRKAGQVTDARGDILNLLCNKSTIFGHPETHASQIVDALGSVAIYPPGTMAPNSSLTFFVGQRKGQGLEFLPFSGVIPLGGPAARAGCREIKNDLISMAPTAPPDFLAPDMFDLSLLPTRAQIEQTILQLPAGTTMGQLLKPPAQHPFKLLTHMRLQQVVNQLGAGIYYMITCRSTSRAKPYTVRKTKNWRNTNYGYTLRNAIADSTLTSTGFQGTRANRNLLLSAIGEAETRRKSAIPGSKFTRVAANYRGGGTRRRLR